VAQRPLIRDSHLVVLLVAGKDGRVVEHGGEHVDRGDGDQEQEGRFHQGALVDRLAAQDAHSQGQQDGRPGTVHHRLVEQQPLRPPVCTLINA